MSYDEINNLFPDGYINVVGNGHAEKAAAIAKYYKVKFVDDGDRSFVSCPSNSSISNDLTYDEEAADSNLNDINNAYGVSIMLDDLEF